MLETANGREAVHSYRIIADEFGRVDPEDWR